MMEPRVRRLSIPLAPLLQARTFSFSPRARRRSATVPCLLDAPSTLFLGAGRMALAIALRLAGIGEGDEVLLPAYSSRSIVTPILLQRAKPIFYRIGSDLRADLKDIADKAGPRTRALIGINFFGFAQNWTALRAFADTADLVLIEDCAHALFGAVEGRPLGSSGDYAIASLSKFLPVWDGGVLRVNKRLVELPKTHALSLYAQLKAVTNLMEEAVSHGCLPWARPLTALIALMHGLRRTERDKQSAMVAAPASLRRDVTGDIDPASILAAPAWISRFVTEFVDRERAMTIRRGNYVAYRRAFQDIRGARMSFDLQEGEVPYMAPVWVDDLDRWYPVWRQLDVPMQRYAEVLWPGAAEACPVSAALSRHLVQFPCHQDIDETHIADIADIVRRSSANGGPPARSGCAS